MLYYSHINEDSRIERRLLELSKCSAVVVVAGSGERALALMDCVTCKRLVAVDINEEALFLLQLKLTVLANKTVETYLQFIGQELASEKLRLSCFEEVKGMLSKGCRSYWEQRKKSIARGILYAGRFERFLKKIRPLVNGFLGPKFKRIFEHDFNVIELPLWRWKIVGWMFSQRSVYKLLGNEDIAFTGAHVRTTTIPAALNDTINTGKAYSSFIAHLIFKGHLKEMAEEDLPPSLQRKVLTIIQERLRTGDLVIDYHLKDILAFTKDQLIPERAFYSISDILSFEDQEYVYQLLQYVSVPGSVIVGRSFLRNRLTPDQLNELAISYEKVETLDDEESTGMYQVFSVTIGVKQEDKS